MRAFLGIDLPENVREAMGALQRQLAASAGHQRVRHSAATPMVAASAADVKWVSPAQLHVTLKFLDEISEAQRQAIEERVGQVVRREPSFRLGIEGVGAFPSINAPRVIWVGLSEGKECLARLAASIEQALETLDVRKEERLFASHLTIGRVRSPQHLQALVQRLREVAWQPPAAWDVTSITLYHSVLSSSGPRYTVLAIFPLSSRQ